MSARTFFAEAPVAIAITGLPDASRWRRANANARRVVPPAPTMSKTASQSSSNWSKNVPLLPFERIMEIFKRQVFMSVYCDQGHPITYKITAKNDGNQTLTGITVVELDN